MVKLFKKKVKISPSVLSLKLEEIADRLKKIEKEIDYVHIDVMDGKFVTNSTDGQAMFNNAKEGTKNPLDVHLMVENPLEEIDKYLGAEIITFHIEALNNDEEILKVIQKTKSLGSKVGISIKPKTPVSILNNWLNEIDLVLIMTVEPGYGGQPLDFEVLPKIKELRALGFNKLIEVDGGITLENVKEIKKTDIDIIVAGTAIFSAENELKVIKNLKK